MPKISVIMPVYNTKEEWLRQSIESILNQTYIDFEFIIINDGSTNNVKDVILSYKDNRIKYIEQENMGLAKSLNNGLEIASGEYIARMDSDDISLLNRFEKQIEFMNSHPEIQVCGTWFEIFPETKIAKHPPYPKYIDILKGCCIGHPTVMFKRADFEKYNLKYNPEYKCEDYELWSRAIRYLNFANIQQVLLKYRWHKNNLSKQTEEFVTNDKKIKQNMLDFLTDDKDLQQKMKKLIFQQQQPKEIKYNFWEKIFSVKNYTKNDVKRKVICIFGIKIKLKKILLLEKIKLKNIKRQYPKVMSTKETLEEILKGKSIARFGDGELLLMMGISLGKKGSPQEYQIYDKNLSKRLIEIIKNPTENCIIAIDKYSDYWNDLKNYKNNMTYFENFWLEYWKNLKSYYNYQYKYGCTAISRISVFKENKLDTIKQIWNNKKVLFVVGNGSHFVFEERLFNNIQQADMLVVKGRSSFSDYDNILEKIKTYNKDWLIFMALGPTATVLAYDLSKLGYQAIDMGHLPNCYLHAIGERERPEVEHNKDKQFKKTEGLYKLIYNNNEFLIEQK